MCDMTLLQIRPATHTHLVCELCSATKKLTCIAETDWLIRRVGWEGVSGLPPAGYIMICPDCQLKRNDIDWGYADDECNYFQDTRKHWYLNAEVHYASCL